MTEESRVIRCVAVGCEVRTPCGGRGRRTGTGVTLLLAFVALAGCEEVEVVVDRYRDLTPHEAYALSLADAGLENTALARAWKEAAEEAVTSPVEVSLPHREEGWLSPEAPTAVGYRVSLERGQALSVEVDLAEAAGAESTRVFVDFFRVPEDPEDPLRPLEPEDTLSLPVDAEGEVAHFAFDAYRDGEFILRVQPELLRGGRYRIDLGLAPSLAFPVEGRNERAIQSFFGAERDGGVRDHHGVDIFAPRGTPALAATDARVTRVQNTSRGGKVVWLEDLRHEQSLYYAHLDSQYVSRGDIVSRGDTVGFVGNTGNARTTPPHLHFGIYQRGVPGGYSRRRGGPVDPMNFVRRVLVMAPDYEDDFRALGKWVRIENGGTNLRAAASTRSEALAELAEATPLRVLAGNEEWWRVELPDGRAGYVAARLTEPLDTPLDETVVAVSTPLLVRPGLGATAFARIESGTSVALLGRFGGYELVELAGPPGATGPRRGWMPVGADRRP